MPFLLKTHCIKRQIDADSAVQYVTKHFRMHQHVREPLDIDYMVTQGYHVLYDALYLCSDSHDFFQFIAPTNAVLNNEGYSFEDEAKFKGKSRMLVDFFKPDRPDF